MEVALVYFALLALAFFFLIVRPQRRRVTRAPRVRRVAGAR